MGSNNIKKIDVVFLMRRSCKMCSDIKRKISDYMNDNININFKIIDLDSEDIIFEKKHSSITPALWVNNRMWYAGGFELEKFDKKFANLIK